MPVTGPLWGLRIEGWGRKGEGVLNKLWVGEVCICSSKRFRVVPKQSRGSEETTLPPTPAVLLCSSRLLHLSPVSMHVQLEPRGPVGTVGLCAARIHLRNRMQAHPGVSFLKGHFHNLFKSMSAGDSLQWFPHFSLSGPAAPQITI